MTTKLLRCLLALFIFCFSLGAAAQDLATPSGYLMHFGKAIETMNQTYMNYLSAVSHGKRARKVEKLRVKTLDAILNAKGEIMGAPAFKGDRTYKDAMAEYIKTCYAVFNEDYHKIVDMEEVAEQSYDGMEAYLLAQKKAGEKLKEAGEKQHTAQKEFAAKNNVTLTDTKDELDIKLETAGKLNEYHDKVYLLFFKSYKQDMYLTDAINKGDLSGMEQARNALETYSAEGLKQLGEVGSYGGDATLVIGCKAALNFYRDLATKKMEPITNFLLASQNFDKLKKAMEKMPEGKRTQADIDGYNKAVNEMNKNSTAYNKSNAETNKGRTDAINGWNGAVKSFMDAQMPYAK